MLRKLSMMRERECCCGPGRFTAPAVFSLMLQIEVVAPIKKVWLSDIPNEQFAAVFGVRSYPFRPLGQKPVLRLPP
jgi:hypothetical protein